MKAVVCVFALCLALYASSAETQPTDQPAAEYLPPAAEIKANDAAADDGYRYRTVRRLKYRQRRDVSQEYLPPIKEPTQEYLPPDKAATKLADDGYQYRTVRKLKYRARHRRDVSEIAPPSHEYLPPASPESAESPAPEVKTNLAEDGYRYRTVRRLKYRRHRRDAEAEEVVAADDQDAASVTPANEYLPPTPAAAEEEPAVKSADLGTDGYRYKTVRKVVYRQRY